MKIRLTALFLFGLFISFCAVLLCKAPRFFGGNPAVAFRVRKKRCRFAYAELFQLSAYALKNFGVFLQNFKKSDTDFSQHINIF